MNEAHAWSRLRAFRIVICFAVQHEAEFSGGGLILGCNRCGRAADKIREFREYNAWWTGKKRKP